MRELAIFEAGILVGMLITTVIAEIVFRKARKRLRSDLTFIDLLDRAGAADNRATLPISRRRVLMDERKTTTTPTNTVKQTGLTEFGDELPRKVGPFDKAEIEKVAKRCATRLGIDWDESPLVERKQKLGIAVDVLRGNLSPRVLEDHRNRIPSDTRTFGLMVLEEFKNSPEWDSDEYNRGYVASNADTPSKTTDAGGVGGIEHSDR